MGDTLLQVQEKMREGWNCCYANVGSDKPFIP